MLKVKSLKEKIKAYYIDLVKGKRKGARVKLFSFFLLLFSFVYGFFVKLVLSCYQIRLLKSHKIGCRVISVGNITWGGTGKTPLVETLVKVLKQKGRRLAILIRGYGKDEVEMLKSKFKDIPVLVGRDRIKAARVAQERYGADTIILDDGFQHWRLRRDLDIVLIDTSLPFGNRRVIPRGILREPLSSLSRADAFVLTRTNEAPQNVEPIKKELRRYNRHAAIYEAIHAPTSLRNLTTQKIIDLSRIKDEQIAALSGIGTPESFTRTLKLLGAKVSLEFHFPDHYQYSKEDLEKIERQCLAQQIKTVITTEKDAARLIPLLKPQSGQAFEILALRIEVKIVKEEERFFNFLNSGKGSQVPYFILILSDGKAGHLNQSKAVAQIIRKRKIEQGRRPDEVNRKIVEVKFKNRLCQLLLSFCPIFSNPYCHRCFACLRFCLKKSSFEELMQARANIIVSAGSSLSAVSVFLSYKKEAQKVILMKPPFLSLDRFDLVIIPEHDQAKPKDNVLTTRITPNLIDRQYLQEQANILKTRYKILDTRYQNGPTIGVLIGGDTAGYRLSAEMMNKIVAQLKETAQNLDCLILVTTSRRTPEAVEKLLRDNLKDFERCKLLVIANEKNIPEAVGGILGLSDIIIVSGESISMVSEALSAEKYVLAFIPEKKPATEAKQERFLKKLEKEKILKIIQPENLLSEIEKTWKDKPKRINIRDKELIYQAISKIV